jgi:hypothetical protein
LEIEAGDSAENSAFFLLLLAHALLFAALGRFGLNMGGHAAGAHPPFDVGEGKGRAEAAGPLGLDAVAAVTLFDDGAAVGFEVVDGGAVHNIHLSFTEKYALLVQDRSLTRIVDPSGYINQKKLKVKPFLSYNGRSGRRKSGRL